MSKEPTKREDLPKSEQSRPKDDKRVERDDGDIDVPNPKEGQAEVYERRERGAKGEPNVEDFSAGEYHGLTPQQIKKIEDARYDDTDDVTTVDGAGTQAEEQQRILEEQDKAERDRLKEQEKMERDRQTKEKADRDEREKEAEKTKGNKTR